jgi:hypothetical protein
MTSTYRIISKQLGTDKRFTGSEFFHTRLEIDSHNKYVKVMGAFEIQCYLHNTYGLGIDIDSYIEMKRSDTFVDKHLILNYPAEFYHNLESINWAYSKPIDRYSRPLFYLADESMFTLISLKFAGKIYDKTRKSG